MVMDRNADKLRLMYEIVELIGLTEDPMEYELLERFITDTYVKEALRDQLDLLLLLIKARNEAREYHLGTVDMYLKIDAMRMFDYLLHSYGYPEFLHDIEYLAAITPLPIFEHTKLISKIRIMKKTWEILAGR